MPLATSNDRRRDLFDLAARKLCRRPPMIDYGYHSVPFGESSAHYLPVPSRSFWNIAGDYLKDEARHDFWGEAVLFAFMTIAAVLPLINGARTLIEFLRAITSR